VEEKYRLSRSLAGFFWEEGQGGTKGVEGKRDAKWKKREWKVESR